MNVLILGGSCDIGKELVSLFNQDKNTVISTYSNKLNAS